jgi:ABC-type antimicrobial peptide transport system permease subunit
MIVRETLALVTAGVAIGVPIALALSRYITSLLFGLSPTDAVTIALVVALMAVIALAAAIGPSRRATRIDPVRALRYE